MPPHVALERVLLGTAGEHEHAAIRAFVNQRRDEEHGPWGQDISLARSTDGLAWTTVPGGPVLTGAAVAELVRGDDGRLYLFHVDGDLEKLQDWAVDAPERFETRGFPGLGALALAVSDDDGRTFEPVADFAVRGLVRGMVVDPDVVRLPDGTWRLYYVGVPIQEYGPDTWRPGTPHQVWYAESSDLVRWQQVGPAVLGPYADPAVACFQERCTMVSFGLDRSMSDDGGKTFAYGGTLNEPGFAPDIVYQPDGRWRMWWNSAAVGAPLRTGTSPDLQRWTSEPASLDRYGEAPSVVADGDGWLMAYHHFAEGVTPPDGAVMR